MRFCNRGGNLPTEPIISVSGLRGVIGESLTPEVALRFSCAFAGALGPGPVVVSRDGRATGPMLADAIRSGLLAMGRDCLDADVAATPTTGVLVREHRAAGGIQISASHNPAEYNGLKLFGASGRVLTAQAGQEVIARYRAAGPKWAPHDRLGRAQRLADVLTPHLRLVLATVDVARIRARGFRVLLDANHGAGGELGRRLLEELGCQVTLLGAEPDGQFAHLPEPTAENLSGVLASVTRAEAQIGFCQDPDADRLAVIDERGRYLGEEYTLALCVEHGLRQRPGPVVTNCSTSRMTEDLADRFGVGFFRSAVGEANVVEMMESRGAVLGGEGNGGLIDPRVGYVRDSFAGMAQILDALADRGAPISQLADALPRYEMVKTKVPLAADKTSSGFAALAERFSDARQDLLDGIRLDWPGQWLLVRASNTEPIVRIMAEASTADEGQRLCAAAKSVLESV